MKKIMLIIIMTFTTLAITAQNTSEKKQTRKEMKENFTPEQRAELRAKKMTLELNLDDSQQQKVKQLFVEMLKHNPARSNMKEMTDEEKFEAKSARLDRRIAMKKQLKEILSEGQFTKWEKSIQDKRRGYSRHKRNSEKRGSK